MNSVEKWVKAIRSKYFPDTSIHANIKTNCSWVWKGIQKQLTFIKQHCRWRLGRGNKIKIWLDVWIPGMSKPPTPKHGVTDSEQYIWVMDLFLQDSSQWNSELLHHLFDSNVVDLILNLRIPTAAEDKLIWSLIHNGFFTLKSAYNKLHELSLGNLQTFDKIPNSTITWKKLWNVKTWPRVKHFWWKCLTDSLPTKVRLARNRGYTNCLCPLCNQYDESLMHILFYYPFSRAVWMQIPGATGILTGNHNSIYDMFESWMIQPQHQLNTAMIVSWSIWNERCEVQFQGKTADLILVAKKAISFSNYIQKLNYSVSVTTNIGRWKGYKSKCYVGIKSSEQAECLAFLDAIRWGVKLQYTHIVFETDLQEIDSYINHHTPAVSWENEDILLDAVDSLKYIPQWDCKFVFRSCNKPADKLAKFCRHNGITREWLTETPRVIERYLLSNLESVS
ncbi:uncharacterized protein LOC113324157 [Papaver somniferum]|uniref:uncharacterized protein LOC113324157 n=1 Tax=Papaver somniferum TaxID=3469 RepID=UPI000E6F8C7C|nr:uncharacterized protein LOC113324157 [Papaver somniferum]